MESSVQNKKSDVMYVVNDLKIKSVWKRTLSAVIQDEKYMF